MSHLGLHPNVTHMGELPLIVSPAAPLDGLSLASILGVVIPAHLAPVVEGLGVVSRLLLVHINLWAAFKSCQLAL